jgi:hypothetical protein
MHGRCTRGWHQGFLSGRSALGRGVPVLVLVPDADGEADWSRGMRLVDALAARWGYERGGGQAVTWFELCST